MEDLNEVFQSVASYFSVLSEPTRLHILHAIWGKERTVSDIVAATNITQTNVSRHLSLMHRAGVVARRKDGTLVYYRISDPTLIELYKTACVTMAGRIEAKQPLKANLLSLIPPGTKIRERKQALRVTNPAWESNPNEMTP